MSYLFIFLSTFLLGGGFFFFFLILIYLFVAMHQLSLVAVSRGYSPVAVQEILTGVASLIAEHGL